MCLAERERRKGNNQSIRDISGGESSESDKKFWDKTGGRTE